MSAIAWPTVSTELADANVEKYAPRTEIASGAHKSQSPSGAIAPFFVDCSGRALPFAPSAELIQLMSAVAPSVRAKFENDHLAALELALMRTRPRPARHRLDFRVSLPFFKRRYYLVLLGGDERRSRARLTREGQNEPWRLSVAYAVLMSVVASATMTGIVLLLYFLKSIMGVNVFEGHSVLHNLFY